MSCLNIPKYLLTYDQSNPQILDIGENSAVRYKNKFAKKNRYDYYYIQFSNDYSFKLISLDKVITQDEISNIRSKKVFLVLDNSLEYFLTSADMIYNEIVIKQKIPAEQIIFLTAVPTMLEHVKKLSKSFNQPEIKVEYFSVFEEVGKDTIRQIKDFPTLEKKKKYSKKFLNLNRRWRLHRPLMVTMLRDRNLLEQGYVSLAKSDDGINWNTAYRNLQLVHSNHEEITNILKRNSDVINMPDLYLDQLDLVTNRAMHENTINDYYRETYFSVVNETTYYEDIPFFSEKIFKAIAMRHPFIIATAPNSLQYLKNMGYKTYHPIIDESYDSILDHGDRMIAIVKEIERLCKMDKKELKGWLVTARQIAYHNYRTLARNKLSKPLNF